MINKLLLLTSLFFFSTLSSQTNQDRAVELWADVQVFPAQITLNWVANTNATSYTIERKAKGDPFWTTLLATLPSTATQYVDNSVSVGIEYEYAVSRIALIGPSTIYGYGYISSGIEIPEVANRGKLILLISDTFSTTLLPEINRLIDDLEGDGWNVLMSYVSPTTAVTSVKAQISTIYNADPTNTKALFLLGHVPVPYSGSLAPDGHTDHIGAWPADVYYGELDGTWTDVTVNNTSASLVRNHNVPGDGKFDQTNIPTDIELQIGRVDLYDMPSFTLSETQLIKNYLDKDHDYRKKNFSATKAAVIDDNFGYFGGEAFASSAYKNFGPLVTPTNVVASDYFTTMTGNSYQWSYACGGGSWNLATGVGTTSDFATSNLQGVFTMMFGSYFGDWDITDNFLRAALCQGKTLTNVWSGRPHWLFHPMGMGENIGYCTQMSQNNSGVYFANFFFRRVHIALMGDPTLRNDIVAPVSNVVATKVGNDCVISWSASPETTLIGYNIYMKNATNTSYVKINASPITSNTYTDNCLVYPGIYKYMVRALKLEISPSGSYFNMSEGIADTANNTSNFSVLASFSTTVIGNSVSVVNSSTNTTNNFWDFGNGVTSTLTSPPPVTYTANGSYTVTLIASNICQTVTTTSVVTILSVGLPSNLNSNDIVISPNPAIGKIKIANNNNKEMDITILSLEGQLIFSKSSVLENEEINLNELAKGLYFIEVKTTGKTFRKKLVLE